MNQFFGVKKKAGKGMTLIELLVVIAIIGVIASISVPAYQNYILNARLSNLKQAINQCEKDLASRSAANEPMDGNSIYHAFKQNKLCSMLQNQQDTSINAGMFYHVLLHIGVRFDSTWPVINNQVLGLLFRVKSPEQGVQCHSYFDTLRREHSDIRNQICY